MCTPWLNLAAVPEIEPISCCSPCQRHSALCRLISHPSCWRPLRGWSEPRHAHIRVHSLNADFTTPLSLPVQTGHGLLGYFPGSTIGNFPPTGATAFLTNARRALGTNTHLLIGADLVKPVHRIEQAYNDSQGITAAFNRNILVRINAELGGNFEPDQFAHRAFFNQEHSRIEMHLVSLVDQEIMLDSGHRFEFRAGESIHTENSHKYTVEQFNHLAGQAGWRPRACWIDDERLFSVHLLRSAA